MATTEAQHRNLRARAPRGPLLWGRFEQGRPRAPTPAGVLVDGVDVATGRPVAIEIGDALTSLDARARFLREAAVAQRLGGANVLTVHASGTLPDGTPVVVSDAWVSDLAREVHARGPVPAEQAAASTLALAEAVARAHALGLVHGDLGPEAVRVTREAGPPPPDGGAREALRIAWTTAGKVARGPLETRREDAASDLRGLGRILRALVSGVTEGDEEAAGDGAKTLPDGVAHIVARALATGPGAYPSVVELAEDLARLAPEGHVAARRIAELLAAPGDARAESRPDPHAGDPVQPVPWLGAEAPVETRHTRAGAPSRDRTRHGVRLALASLALTALAIAFAWALDRALPSVGSRRADVAARLAEADATSAPETRALAEAVSIEALWSPGRGLPAQSAPAEPESAAGPPSGGEIDGETDDASPSPLVAPERAFLKIPLGVIDL